MEVLFAGICLWDTRHRSPDLIGLMPNGTSGATINGHSIPPHSAVVMAPQGSVNHSDWNEQPQSMTIGAETYLLFRLRGDDISFEPVPNGGAASVQGIPKSTCGMNRQLRSALVSASPSATEVLARLEIPGSAQFSVFPNRFRSLVSRIVVADTTRLVSRPFGGGRRSLTFTGSPTVVVANIDLDLAVRGTGPDDQHAHLYCPMFEAASEAINEAVVTDVAREELDGLLFDVAAFDQPIESPAEWISEMATSVESIEAVVSKTIPRRAPRRRALPETPPVSGAPRLADLLTLGPGCSNSSWP